MGDGCILVLHIGNGPGLTLAGCLHMLELDFGSRQLKRLQVMLLLQGIALVTRNNTFLIQLLDLRKLKFKTARIQFGHSERLPGSHHLLPRRPCLVDFKGLLHFQFVGQSIPDLDF